MLLMSVNVLPRGHVLQLPLPALGALVDVKVPNRRGHLPAEIATHATAHLAMGASLDLKLDGQGCMLQPFTVLSLMGWWQVLLGSPGKQRGAFSNRLVLSKVWREKEAD